MLRQCCVCNRIENEGHWVHPTPEQLASREITHGYCDDCFEVCKRQFFASRRKARPVWTQRLGRMLVRTLRPNPTPSPIPHPRP